MSGLGHLSVRPEWLALHDEPVIEAGLPIVDCHHHLWDRPDNRFETQELVDATTSGHDVRGSVFVECWSHYDRDVPARLASLGETRYVAMAARASRKPLMQGIVANVDLTLGSEAGPLLDLHRKAAGGRLRGVRHIAAWHPVKSARGSAANPPPSVLMRRDFRRGVKELASRALAFDAWLYHTQLEELDDLAAEFPELRIVLNHVGGPIHIGPYAGRRDEVLRSWRAAMRLLSRRPNVFVKIGGFGMRMFALGFNLGDRPPDSRRVHDAVKPYVDTVIDLFGTDRCMFESNFPVDRACFSYKVYWNACKLLVSGRAREEQVRLLSGTAAEAYQLEIDLSASPERLPCTA